jgi:hypothetical protein
MSAEWDKFQECIDECDDGALSIRQPLHHLRSFVEAAGIPLSRKCGTELKRWAAKYQLACWRQRRCGEPMPELKQPERLTQAIHYQQQLERVFGEATLDPDQRDRVKPTVEQQAELELRMELANHPYRRLCQRLHELTGTPRDDFEDLGLRLLTQQGLEGREAMVGPNEEVLPAKRDLTGLLSKLRELDRDGATGRIVAEFGMQPTLPKTLTKNQRLAYMAFQHAESCAGKSLKDKEAYEILHENGVSPDKGDLGELEGYKLPGYDTWARYVREARKALGEQKYSRRAGRPLTTSIARPSDI